MAKRRPVSAREAQSVFSASRIKEHQKAAKEKERAEIDEQMVALYKGGDHSLSAIGAEVGLSDENVRTRLIAKGVTLRPSTFREPKFYLEKSKAHRGEAARLEQLAAHLLRYPALRPPAHLLRRTTGL